MTVMALAPMELYLKLTGLIPSKKNSRITVRATGRSFPSKKYREWHDSASIQLLEQKPTKIPGSALAVNLHFTFGTLRRADLTNKAESVMDLLVDRGVLVDDSWRAVPRLVLVGEYKKGCDGVTISIHY